MRIAKSALRWLVLLIVVLNVVFNIFYARLFHSLEPIATVADHYYNFFTPASYTFLIWGVIYGVFIAYALFQLFSVSGNQAVLNELGWPVIAVNFFCSVWIVFFSSGQITASLLTMGVILSGAGVLYIKAHKYRRTYFLIKIPFSIFFGWITVATFANFSTWLTASYNVTASMPTILLMRIACVVAVYILIRYKDIVYMIVILWALSGIAVENYKLNEKVSYHAILLAIGMAVFAIIYFLKRLHIKSKMDQHKVLVN